MSERTQTVDMKCAQLLVVSPDHGRVIYQWEKKIMLDWVPVSVPSDTCLLYARDQGMYRCLVSDEVYNFEVTCTGMHKTPAIACLMYIIYSRTSELCTPWERRCW